MYLNIGSRIVAHISLESNWVFKTVSRVQKLIINKEIIGDLGHILLSMLMKSVKLLLQSVANEKIIKQHVRNMNVFLHCDS